MRCPVCGAESFVVSAEPGPHGSMKRTRHCIGVKRHSFTTFEVYPVVATSNMREMAAAERLVESNAQMFARNQVIALSKRTAAAEAAAHGITEARVRQIRSEHRA